MTVLSNFDFDATTHLEKTSLTFGQTRDETSVAKCPRTDEDVNGDGLLDRVCHFRTRDTGFQAGATEGILRGKTNDGSPIAGRDSVRIVNYCGACWPSWPDSHFLLFLF